MNIIIHSPKVIKNLLNTENVVSERPRTLYNGMLRIRHVCALCVPCVSRITQEHKEILENMSTLAVKVCMIKARIFPIYL